MEEKKEKQYVSDNARLMAEWDWEKNNKLGFYPDKLTCGSGKKTWWKCLKGHEWQASVYDRRNGSGCPYCSSRCATKGENDLLTVNPKLASEWNYDKNSDLFPEKFTVNSSKKVWWKCKKGHEWEATISSRNRGNGCPYCSGRYVIKGKNDLQTVNPTLTQEWNYNKNKLSPQDVTSGSEKKVWWICRKGHEWETTISSRNRGNGCPMCAAETSTSFPEYALVYYLKRYALDVEHSYKKFGYELDIYIPSKRVAIEYDGYFWHKSKIEKDLEKNLKCRKDGIILYRIREDLPSLNDSSIDYCVDRNQKNLSHVIQKVLCEITGKNIDVNIERDVIDIENLREYTEKENSLLLVNPELSKEWHYEKNGKIKPENFLSNSGKKIWWKCSKGHEWKATIGHRNNGQGCPYCAKRKVVKGETDLQTSHPRLAKEWHKEKNKEFLPTQVMPNNKRKVWWMCVKGHEWLATINNRSNGYGCPYCSGRYAINGENDLQTINPILAKEWNYNKNNGLTPADVKPNSNKKVWWQCAKGHEWQATINNRNNGKGCPYCSGRIAIEGENDLQTTNPTLAQEWNYIKNEGLAPTDVLPNSSKRVWWKCSKGHEWQARIAHRNNGCGCPFCRKGK